MHTQLRNFYSKQEAISAVGSVCWKESTYVPIHPCPCALLYRICSHVKPQATKIWCCCLPTDTNLTVAIWHQVLKLHNFNFLCNDSMIGFFFQKEKLMLALLQFHFTGSKRMPYTFLMKWRICNTNIKMKKLSSVPQFMQEKAHITFAQMVRSPHCSGLQLN